MRHRSRRRHSPRKIQQADRKERRDRFHDRDPCSWVSHRDYELAEGERVGLGPRIGASVRRWTPARGSRTTSYRRWSSTRRERRRRPSSMTSTSRGPLIAGADARPRSPSMRSDRPSIRYRPELLRSARWKSLSWHRYQAFRAHVGSAERELGARTPIVSARTRPGQVRRGEQLMQRGPEVDQTLAAAQERRPGVEPRGRISGVPSTGSAPSRALAATLPRSRQPSRRALPPSRVHTRRLSGSRLEAMSSCAINARHHHAPSRLRPGAPGAEARRQHSVNDRVRRRERHRQRPP